jgi:hypothetical protein
VAINRICLSALFSIHLASGKRGSIPPDDDHFTSISQQIDNTTPQAKTLLDQQRQKNSVSTQETPDTWIYLYSTDRLPPVITARSTRSSVSAELEPFDGKALEWFSWIDLFRALVHDTPKSPGEKLALLKRFLREDCLDLVYGLGGGEAAYIEALVRLKQTCGRRDVMRAAHHQAIQKFETKQDPASFKRFAERIATRLFDLSRIGETGTTNLIEKVCLKLHLHDRLAWNEDRRGRIEDRSLNTFGMWPNAPVVNFPVPPRIRTLSASQPIKSIRLCPNRLIIDAKLGPIRVQQRWQVNINKFPSPSLENRSVLNAKKDTDYRIVKISNYSPSGSALPSPCAIVFASVVSRPNIQFTNVTGKSRVNTLVAVITITRCYTMLPRKNRRQKPKKKLDLQPQESEPLDKSPWVCCVFQ